MSVAVVQTCTRFDGVALTVCTYLTSRTAGIDMEPGAYEDGVMVADVFDFDKRAGLADYRQLLDERAIRADLGLRIVEVIPEYAVCHHRVIASEWRTQVIGP